MRAVEGFDHANEDDQPVEVDNVATTTESLCSDICGRSVYPGNVANNVVVATLASNVC